MPLKTEFQSKENERSICELKDKQKKLENSTYESYQNVRFSPLSKKFSIEQNNALLIITKTIIEEVNAPKLPKKKGYIPKTKFNKSLYFYENRNARFK